MGGREEMAAGDTGADVTEDCCCSLAVWGYIEVEAEGGSIRLVMEGDALALLRGGEIGGALAALCTLDSNMPPRIGSYLWPELAGRGVGVEGAATLMCERLGLLCK